MLNFSGSNIVSSTTRKLAAGTGNIGEGLALVAKYEGGALVVAPSTGAAGEVFVGVSVNNRYIDKTYPVAPTRYTADANGLVVLPNAPLPSALKVTAAADGTVLTSADAAATGKYVLNGNTLTVDADLVIDVAYDYSPSVVEALARQGDTWPGVGAVALQGATGVIEAGDIQTNQFDPTADWSLKTIKLGANGRFTTGGSGVTLTGVIITQIPTAEGGNVLGLRFGL